MFELADTSSSRLDVATVLQATNARVVQILPDGTLQHNSLGRADLQERLDEVVVDSRQAGDASLFVALRGENVDGHDYVARAFDSGAAGSIVAHVPDELAVRPAPRTRFLFVVPNPQTALQDLAGHWRRRHRMHVIGVTGSIGKTTTKEVIASLLASRHRVLRSQANHNTEIGMPLTLLRLRQEHEIAVLEMGMYAPGDIALLASIAQPEMGVVTNVAPIHLERCGTIERIARAKSELPAAIPPDGLVVVNGDNSWTRAMARASGVAPAVMTGLSRDCEYRATDVRALALQGMLFTLQAEGRQFEVRTSMPGAHTVQAFLMAAAVARRIGMAWDEIVPAMRDIRSEARQRIERGPHDTVLIDDSYNAAPPSMEAALQLLGTGDGVRIAVLGDMLELGPEERAAHVKVGESAAAHADWLVARGERARWIAEGAVRAGMAPDRVIHVDTNPDAASATQSILSRTPVNASAAASPTMQRPAPQDDRADRPAVSTILIKGSRGMKMEEVVDALRGLP